MRWEATYPPDFESCTTARHDVTAAAERARVAGVVLEPLEVVTAELVSNAVRHGRTGFAVAVELERGRARVAVFDAGMGRPEVLAPAPDVTWGRGLAIVAALASGWGWRPATRDGVSGKVVWADVAAPGSERGVTDASGARLDSNAR